MAPVGPVGLFTWLTGLALFAGSTLLLSHLRWFRRRPLVDRLAPYVAGGAAARRRGRLPPAAPFREMLGPLAQAAGERIARLLGVTEPLAVRLERVHSPLDPDGFRVRQMGWAAGGLAAGVLVATVLRLPGPLAAGFVVGGPVLGFLVVEQRLAAESDRWKQRLVLELPVVAEQVGMLIGAGYSLGAALSRVATRGHGCCQRDLARVQGRVRQGLTEAEALREWADVADVPALHRFVSVLALDRHGGDLARLVGQEARSVRRDVHRELIAAIERRGQQVWIPVTVAALVPGVIFLAVPFIDALRMFAGS